ncbi:MULTISPECIES: CPBP family intramembrane glutamic endopeptidase [unclassified Bacillus (in: firmicutes)]|uniref:CPBP family intramembrane glutamic endopeptidase n=1 Tax=unclassified Bacillus (in: firmicutes) TaxID=185979 RepID=UPI0008DEEA2E|nr:MULTISPECIES: CPBP family intramembrane glutamic endopeptidase [unclassified Bacillus (in: firmicutes)]SFB03651.1 CAAX protease self-immunity [Bacillus sp. UNCCL13]SFQ88743.1 CAAX protease self-immunity [Bacillus sp. cl95]
MRKKIEIRKLFSAYTPDQHMKRDIGVGLAITAFAMVGIFAVSLAFGLIEVVGNGFNAKTILFYTGLILVAAGWEEFLYRFILLSLLIKVLKRPWIPLLLTAIVFGAMHASNDHATWLSVVSNGLGGIMYGLAFIGTRKIWLPWALHFAWNYVQAPLLGFPVSGFEVEGILKLKLLDHSWLSGGLYGPEGGIVGISFRIVVIALILLWINKSRGSFKNITQETPSGISQPPF